MTQIACLFALTLLLPAELPAQSETPRKPNPFAPSLPLLTDEEEEQLDQIIDRFIQYDIGKLRGEEGKKALAEFHKLGPPAIPALIRGMNRAAHIEGSCPAVTIARKLSVLFNASDDMELLEFARENIGAGVTQSRHMGVLRELRVVCMLRKRTVAQKPVVLRPAAPAQNTLRTMSTSQILIDAAGKPSAPNREALLKELEQRPRDQVVEELGGLAADTSNQKAQLLARNLLASFLDRQSASLLKEKLKDRSAEVRAAAVKVLGGKGLSYGGEVIDMLGDEDAAVVQASRQALTRLNRGVDFGPEEKADDTARVEAIRRWRVWWASQGAR